MDETMQEDISPQTERELMSPLSPKRPRTDSDSTPTTNHGGKSRFDFPALVRFRKTISFPSSPSKLKDIVCAAECGVVQDEQRDAKLILSPITKLTTPHGDGAHTGSSNACFISAERRFLPLVEDEQPPVTESDKLSSNPVDDAGGPLAETDSGEDTSADPSSHPDCKWLGESHEVEPPGGCNSSTGNDEDERQVLDSVSQIQVFTHSSGDEEVRCQSDCTCENTLHDTGFCNTWNQSGEVEKSNQKKYCHGFSENREQEERDSPISSSDYADTKSFFSNPEEDPSGNLAEGVRNERKILELQICENENVAFCDGETKSRVNENGLNKNSIPSAAECAEGSIVLYDLVLDRNIATETVSLDADDFCGVKEEHAAGEMIAKAQSETADHTTETPMPARISQEPAEGDNDAGPFSVIDPTIWSETDREAGEEHCNSESSAGAKLSPSVKVCEMEMPLPLCSGVGPSQEASAPDQSRQFNHQSRTQQCNDEKEDLYQSYAEQQTCAITTNEKHNKTGNEGSCLCKSSPSSSPEPPPAGDARQESHDTVRHQLKEQDEAGCFPVSLDAQKTQEVEYIHTEIVRMDEATEITEREEIQTDEHRKSENLVDLEERLMKENEIYKEDKTEVSADVCMDWTEGGTSEYGDKLTCEEFESILECLTDHAYSALIQMMEGETERKERTEEASVGEKTDGQHNSEISVASDGHQQRGEQRGDVAEASPDDCESEWTEGNMSNCANKLTSASQHEPADKLSCFSDHQHKAETFMVVSSPATSDAVVPGPHELIPSQNADSSPTALNGHDRFSSVPSAFTFCDRVPEGFDTFEKIQLSLDDDDDDDAGPSTSPLISSLPRQLLKSPQPQLQHSMPEAESNEHEEAPEEAGEGEEEVEGFQCHTENMANGFLNSDYSCNELQNFISAADVTALEWPEQQNNSESTCNSTECFQDESNPHTMSSNVSSESDSPAADVNHQPQFEMKKHFDMVLKELNLYFDISMSDFASDSKAAAPQQRSDVTEVSEDDTSNCKEQLSSPEVGCHISSGNK